MQRQSGGTSKKVWDLKFPLKKPTSLIFIFGRLAGSSVTKLIGLHKLSAFLDIYFIYRYRYNMEVDEEKIDTYNISVGFCFWFCRLDVVLKLGCIGAGLLWLYRVKSVEDLYPSPPLGVDNADTSQLPKEKNLHGQFQYFKITQPGSSTVTPLYQ